MTAIVDTNVAVVANGRETPQASSVCVAACALRLQKITSSGTIVIDDGWLILREYQNNLRSAGQPGVGDAFLKWVLTNLQNPDRCQMVHIAPTDKSGTCFSEFPEVLELAGFDPDDRKFVAVALAHPDCPPVLQAVDPGWWHARDALSRQGVTVDFLCVDDVKALAQ